jgi:hypothetical protein
VRDDRVWIREVVSRRCSSGGEGGRGFADNELRQIGRDAKLSESRADKLVKVRRLDGSEAYLILHVEVQTSYDATWPGGSSSTTTGPSTSMACPW